METPAERRLHARVAAYARWAREQDRAAATAAARRAFLAKFAEQVDPGERLPPAEREKRARAALKAHMCRLAMKRGRS